MALTVNHRGVLGVAWTDARHAYEGDDCYDIYFTASLDGGESFLSERRITEATSCPKVEENGAIGRIFAPSGGDYIGMIAESDGRFRLMWSDARNGPFELWTALVDVSGLVSPRE